MFKEHEIDSMSFDDNKKNKEFIKTILNKKGKHRSKKELLFIIKYFMNYKFFKELQEFLPTNLLIALCRDMKYFMYYKDETIFYEGDIGHKYYIIIEGKVDVLEEKLYNDPIFK